MTIKFKNPQITNFFKDHSDLDIEDTILKFIDIMDMLYNSMNNSMNDTKVMEILEGIKRLNTSQERTANELSQIGTNIQRVDNNVVKLNQEIEDKFVLKMGEAKKDYIDHVKMALVCNVTDRIEPILKEQNKILFEKTDSVINSIVPKNEKVIIGGLQKLSKHFQEVILADTRNFLNNVVDKESLEKNMDGYIDSVSKSIERTQQMFNNMITATEKRLESKINSDISNIGQSINASLNNTEQRLEETLQKIASATVKVSKETALGNQTLSILNDSHSSLLKKFENSNTKGKMSENLIANVIQQIYPAAEIQSVGQTKETGDIILARHMKPKILIENKLWNRPILQLEVAKFIRDIEVQDCCGLFLSQNGKITSKQNYEVNFHNGKILLYLHDVSNDPDKIRTAIDIIDHLYEIVDKLNDDHGEDSNITKELLEYINAEYQAFVASKNTLTKLAKDFNKNIIKQIDDLKMPSLQEYLSSKFSTPISKYTCEYCDFVGKNQQARSAHLRGCTARKKIESGNKEEGANIVVNTT